MNKLKSILRILISLILLLEYVQSNCPNEKEWHEFKSKYSISFYNSTLELQACQNFYAAEKRIKNHNLKNDTKYSMAHNKFSHWSLDQGKLHKGLHYSDSSYVFGKKKKRFSASESNYSGLPFTIYSATPGYQRKHSILYTTDDQMDKIFNSSIKGLKVYQGLNWFNDPKSRKRDQGVCGNCWAFSAIGALEGQIMKKYNKTVHLSVQQLTDCSSDSNYGNNGCKGGNVWNAYHYIYENGIIEDSAYPFYSGMIGSHGQCRFKNGKLDGKPYNGKIYNISSFIWVKQGDDQALIEVLDKYGPVAVALDASDSEFVSYSMHNYGEEECKNGNLDHAALLVGYIQYDLNSDQLRWKIKSRNTVYKAGNEMKIIAQKRNHCGISTYAIVPVLP